MNKYIEKIQNNPENFKINFLFYKRARDAMFDIINNLNVHGFMDIYVPDYIGWSPKEGSGIFDPLNTISDLKRHYYKMSRELEIDVMDLKKEIKKHSILLVVNYFGFRDKSLRELIEYAHSIDCIVIEDNAHGFYTYFCKGKAEADVTFFSLHKMFPFSQGGGMIIDNKDLMVEELNNIKEPIGFNPFKYDYNSIARKREENYRALYLMMENCESYFIPLKDISAIEKNVPQTFPIIIKRGNRDKIYKIMNDAGYGVVSLYHTLIEELRGSEHSKALWLSQHIMNLPIHQDTDKTMYKGMLNTLICACNQTT
mgnify:CR=1 FL=1